MSEEGLSRADKASLIAVAALVWLIGPFGFWLLGSGFAGRLVFWPSFGINAGEALWATLWLLTFYGPLLILFLWLGRKAWRQVYTDKGRHDA